MFKKQTADFVSLKMGLGYHLWLLIVSVPLSERRLFLPKYLQFLCILLWMSFI